MPSIFRKFYRIFGFEEEVNSKDTINIKELEKPEKQNPLPPHDHSDWKTSETSTPWEVHSSWCTKCKTARSHNEYMTDICNNCGNYNTVDYYGCSTRKIWNGTQWVTQFNEKGKFWVESSV